MADWYVPFGASDDHVGVWIECLREAAHAPTVIVVVVVIVASVAAIIVKVA